MRRNFLCCDTIGCGCGIVIRGSVMDSVMMFPNGFIVIVFGELLYNNFWIKNSFVNAQFFMLLLIE